MSQTQRKPESRPRNQHETTPNFAWHDPDRLEAAYDEYGTVVGVARHFGIDESTARRALEKHTDYERTEYGTQKLERMDPGEIEGLSPLRSNDHGVATDGGRPHPDAGGDA